MKINFKTNPCIPFGDIHDSMQLDSGTHYKYDARDGRNDGLVGA